MYYKLSFRLLSSFQDHQVQQDEVIPGFVRTTTRGPRCSHWLGRRNDYIPDLGRAVSLLHRQPMYTGKVTIVLVAWQAQRAAV